MGEGENVWRYKDNGKEEIWIEEMRGGRERYRERGQKERESKRNGTGLREVLCKIERKKKKKKSRNIKKVEVFGALGF